MTDLVKVHQLVVDVVYDLNLGGRFLEKDGPAAYERLTVELVLRDQADDPLGELLLPAVIGQRCFHGRPPCS